MRRFAAACLLLAAACAAHAAQTFRCVPSNNSILFGGYNPLSGTNLDSTATFIVSCTDTGGNKTKTTNIDWTATLSSPALRQLAPPSGTDRLNYNLYVDSQRSAPWGDGTNGTSTITGTLVVPGSATATSSPLTYYGRIGLGQDVSATSPAPSPTTYQQSLTITVTCKAATVAVPC